MAEIPIDMDEKTALEIFWIAWDRDVSPQEVVREAVREMAKAVLNGTE